MEPTTRRLGRLLAYVALTLAAVVWGVFVFTVLVLVPLLATGTVKTYAMPNWMMEPTVHCGRPEPLCEGSRKDRLLVVTRFLDLNRGDIVVYEASPAVERRCGASGPYVRRIVGLPGETIQTRFIRPREPERVYIDGRERVFVDGRELEESYLDEDRAMFDVDKTFRIPMGRYFVMGDNRLFSCDSRRHGAITRADIVGEVVLTYWPPGRISFR